MSQINCGTFDSHSCKNLNTKSRTRGGSSYETRKSIWMELDQEAQTTKRVLDRIPDDKLAWKPHPKSYSLGQLALHIASAPGNVTALAMQDSVEAPNFTQPEPKSRQEILDTFSKSLESAKGNLKRMDDARLASTWSCDVGAADRVSALGAAESCLPPSRAAFRLSADAGCSSAVDLRA